MAPRRLTFAGLALAWLAAALPASAAVVDFQNEEFNFRVVFPAGSQVCPAVAASHPYGFYAWYGQTTACDGAKADTTASMMGVYAAYNTTYQRSASGALPRACRPPKPVAAPKQTANAAANSANPVVDAKPADAQPTDTQPVVGATIAPASVVDTKALSQLAFRRYKSVQCALVQPDGSIDIEVVTQGGKWVDGNDPGFQTPLVNYRASLHTTPDRLDQDLAMFRRFLEKVDIRY